MGETCKTCQKLLQFSESVTICSCFLFCHERCFVKSFCGTYNVNDETDFICQQCGYYLQFRKSFSYSIRCSKEPSIIFLKGALALITLVLIGLFYALLSLEVI